MNAHDLQPTLRIVSSQGEVAYTLDRPEYVIGRAVESDIRVDVETVSAIHARLVREGATYRFVQVGETNPTTVDGIPVTNRLLSDGDRLEVAPGMPGSVSIVFAQRGAALDQTLRGAPIRSGDVPAPRTIGSLSLPTKGTVVIGRSPGSDLPLPSLHVSRLHARLTVTDDAVVLSDMDSSNGTYVNGARIQTRTLAAGDIIRIGPYKLVYRGASIEHVDDSERVRLDAHELMRDISGKVLLDHISFDAQPGEVLAIAGTSGAGKSMLLDALNGMRPPSSGHVLVNGADLYQAYDALRPLIGYVPQASLLPEQLSVRSALRYVGHLRLPPDVGADEVEERVQHVMQEVGLNDRGDVQIGRLSGGQQKRASIAAELIASPGLFFLDEPTSGLDPGLTRRVTEIVRDLATGGSTIVIISHDVESLQSADRLLFLGSGGRLVFVGTPSEALTYFDVDNFPEIYQRVEAEDSGTWRRRLLESEHYREQVAPRLVESVPQETEDQAGPSWDPVALIATGARRGSSAWRQFRITTVRYLDSMLRDRAHLGLLLAQAPIIAVLLALVAGANDFQPPSPEAVTQAAAFGVPAASLASALPLMLAATATWFGAINAARELVKELPIFLRERMAGLRLAPYLASKVVVLALLCLVQTTLLLGIVWLRVDLPASGAVLWGPLELWISLNLAAFAAVGLGLLISASVSNANQAQSLVPIILIPQLIFVGGPGTGTVGQWLSYLTVTHWSVEALKITAEIPYTTEPGGFGAQDLLLRWAALGAMMIVLLSLTAWQVANRRSS